MSGLKFILSDKTLFLPDNLSGLIKRLYSGLKGWSISEYDSNGNEVVAVINISNAFWCWRHQWIDVEAFKTFQLLLIWSYHSLVDWKVAALFLKNLLHNVYSALIVQVLLLVEQDLLLL